MCMIDWNDFDRTFNPTLRQINFITGLIVGSREAHPGNEQEFAVDARWIVRELPNHVGNLDALMGAGYLLCISEQFDGMVTYALTESAVEWCEQTGIIPATSHEERFGSDDWVEALTFDRKSQSNPGRNGFKASVKNTTEVVKQISYTPDEAKAAHREIARMESSGAITERSAAAYRAHVTRRIARIAA